MQEKCLIEGIDFVQQEAIHPELPCVNEVERNLSIVEQNNGCQTVLASTDMEEDEHRKVCCTHMVWVC